MNGRRILLVDDDVELCEMLSEYLANEGYSVEMVHDGASATTQALAGRFDMIVLDVMLPVKNGLDVLRELRTQSQLPVLMLTARGDDVDSIVGLELGADDYLAKPCNPRVLTARIRAVLRRSEAPQNGESTGGRTIAIDDLELNTGSRTVTKDGGALELTSTQFNVLATLMERAGTVISKQELSERALGRELALYDRSLDMHVSNLRKKLGPDDAGDERIKTVRGVGYLYVVN